MNILTFDTEEWYIWSLGGTLQKEKAKLFDHTLDNLLQVLSDNSHIATFFCVGKLAQCYPQAVKLITKNGHEIGCHSDKHVWLNRLSPSQFEEDSKSAIYSLEDLIGKKIISYRAPAFSITKHNPEYLKILSKYGIKNDCSIFPANRDFGGYENFPFKEPCTINFEDGLIREFPINPNSILGKEFVFSGGGYFRFFPYFLIKKFMLSGEYNMFYFHLADLICEKDKMLSRKEYESYFKETGSFKNRSLRYFKSNVGRKGAWNKLNMLLRNFDFINVETASNNINWENKPIFNI